MRETIEPFIRSKVVIGLASFLALLLLCVGVAVAFGIGVSELSPPPATQPDTRPLSLTVIPGGDGVGSTEAAAALQSQSPQASGLAGPSTHPEFMGQPGGVNLQAGIVETNTGTGQEAGAQRGLRLP